MSVERIARALEGIEDSESHAATCYAPNYGCTCDYPERVPARQAAAVLEALTEAAWGGDRKIADGIANGVAALERIAGSPRPQEETPNA